VRRNCLFPTVLATNEPLQKIRETAWREATLSSRQKRRSLEMTIRRNPGIGLQLLVDEITRVLDAPWLPRGHPDSLAQVWEKIEARAALDRLQRDLSGLTRICRKELEKLLDTWPPSLDHLGKARRTELDPLYQPYPPSPRYGRPIRR